jgi:formate hydrogenlyase subunit 4
MRDAMILRITIHTLLLLGLSPLLAGIITRVKSKIAGRRGAPLLQLYYDIAKLLRKNMVLSVTTTWVFRAGPILAVAVPILAALFIPFGPLRAPVSFTGDFVLFTYLFGLSRFFTVIAALDTGSSFEGMGAAREATFSCLAEPTIFIIFMVLTRLSGGLSLESMLSSGTGGVSLFLASVCLFIVLLAENCRIPVDDPTTHLELTMIHEVMVLDHSGPDLGLILYGAAMKLFVLAALLADIARPLSTGDLLLDAGMFIGFMMIIAVAVGLVESGMARLRMIHIPQLLVGTALLSFFSFILLLR